MSKFQIKYSLFVWSNILLLLLALAGCGDTLPSKGDNAVTIITPPVTLPVPTVAATPTCNKPVCLAPAAAPGVRPFIDTFRNIHQAQTFAYGMKDVPTTATQTAKNYDFVWGASTSTTPEVIASLRAGNPNIVLSYYISFNRDTGVFDNQDQRQSLSYWKALHPDWILYKCDRATPAYEINDVGITPFDM